jgi:hypothetical protein
MFSHHNLKVYVKGLAVVASLGQHSVQWDKRHGVVDQLCRASESIVLTPRGQLTIAITITSRITITTTWQGGRS